MPKDTNNQFSADETRRRFEAALRGARLVGHKTHEEARPGNPRPKNSRRAKKAKTQRKST